MAIVNGYCTLAELKARVGIPGADTGDDAILEAVVEAASRSIDRICNRVFYSTAAQTRYFSVHSGIKVFIDDVQSVSLVATDRNLDRTFSNTISAGDYELGPLSAAAYSRPYTVLRIKPLASNTFDMGTDMLKVTGTWGWSAIPDAVNEACLLQAGRLFRRKDAPFGVTGGGDVGTAISLRAVDPDVESLLQGYKRFSLASDF
jgi:hypothetical protein